MSAHSGFALFETPVGVCAIAWRPQGIVALRLPQASPEAARANMQRRFPALAEAAPSAEAQAAIDRVTGLLNGGADGLADVRVDLADAPELARKVYAITRAIPPGATRTYGEIARDLGDPLLAQAVGQALGANPVAIIVPCHRVLAAGGKAGGFSAFGSVATKRKLLAIESVHARREGDLFG